MKGEIKMSIAQNQIVALAKQFNYNEEPAQLIQTLKATAFKGNVSDDQFNALLFVATQHSLNPFTNEIYAFPSNGGIVPVVGVDGWARIINGNSQFDGMEFEQDAESCTCKVYRKDRSHPVSVTEFMEECKRDTKPWKSHPRRMLRHKAMIQAARLAFGFAGIYDEDEAERIKDAKDGVSDAQASPFTGDKDNPVRADLIATGEKVAMRGMEELKGWFQSISREDRAAIGVDELSRLKAIASETVQAEVIQDEAGN